MKQLVLIILLLFVGLGARAQQPFILSKEEPNLDVISDVVEISDQYYFLQSSALNLNPPYYSDCYSDLLIVSKEGLIINQFNLNGVGTYFHRILKVDQNDIYLVGVIHSDSCFSKLIISKFNINTLTLTQLSSKDICDNIVLNIKIANGLLNQFFLDEYHYVGTGDLVEKNIYRIDSTYALVPVFEDVSVLSSLSVDFGRNGYVLAEVGLYNFYDKNFNYRKQRSTFELNGLAFQQTHVPFGHQWILEQTIQPHYSDPDSGLQIRVVDSNLVLKKITTILPPDFKKTINMPFYGGISIANENEIWSSGFFESQLNPVPNIYSITKLDSNLNIICQHFLGYDTHYRIFGIKVMDTGGAVIFGNRLKEGTPINEGEDIYAIRVGENCELPTTSIDDPHPLLSISVYPNPTFNFLTFEVHGFDPASLRVEIFNPEGITLFTAEDLSREIEVKVLPAGQYFYRILQKDKILGVGAWVKS